MKKWRNNHGVRHSIEVAVKRAAVHASVRSRRVVAACRMPSSIS